MNGKIEECDRRLIAEIKGELIEALKYCSRETITKKFIQNSLNKLSRLLEGITSTKTVTQLKSEKSKELETVLAQIEKIEREVKHPWDNINDSSLHDKLHELDELYQRRRILTDFLKELVNTKKLIRSSEEVMTFGSKK